MKVCKLLLAAAGATVLLGTLVSSASARNLSISSQTIRASFSSVEFHLAETTSRCHVTMEGSMHSRTVAKVLGSLFGYVTSAILGPCAAGTATILRETLPWHIRYSGFQGTLPNITSYIQHLVGAAWRIREAGGVACLSRSTAAEPVVGTIHRNTVTGRVGEMGISGTIRTGIECFGISGSFRSDSGRISQLGASHTGIFSSLI
jgi:hypothetical protein